MASENPWQSYHTVFTNAKAGMDGVDKEKVQKVVYELSKGSRFFENEQRKEASVKQRVQQLQAQAARLSESALESHQKIADSKLSELEANRDLSRIWMHVDLDAFYAAVETLEEPSLAGKPMAVGGMSMICTANYEARKFGVRAAMPGFIGKRLCPDLIFVPPKFEKYTRYSEQVREVFRQYDQHFLARSLDEAYLDITEQCSTRNVTSAEVAEELRSRVFEKTGLTCSAGVGPNRMVAKVCSDINKPNGQYVVPNDKEAVMTFFSTLPIRKVSGIGKVTERLLREVLDINVCGDLLNKRTLITALFSSISAEFFLSVGLGIGSSDAPVEESRKSLSCERTFSATSSEDNLFSKLEELAESLAKDMEEEGLQGRTLTLKLKTTDFEVRTRSLSLQSFVYKKEDLFFHAGKLLKAELPVSLRLMGLRISHFRGDLMDPTQRSIADFLCTPTSQAGSMNKDSEQSSYLPAQKREPNSKGISDGCISLKKDSEQSSYSPEQKCEPNLKGISTGVVEEALVLSCLHSERVQPSDAESMPLQTHMNDCIDSSYEATRKGQTRLPLIENQERLHEAHVSNNICQDLQADFQTDSHDVDSESRFFCMMNWINDTQCSLCGFELPVCFIHERQEHMDFHFAQMLQQEYTGRNIGIKSKGLVAENKRLHSPSSKEMVSKKGRSSSKESSNYLPIDAYFSKT